MKTVPHIFLILFFGLFIGCKSEEGRSLAAETPEGEVIPVKYASGFSITDYGSYRIITVDNPWPNAEKSFTYLLAEEKANIPEGLKYDQKIKVPVERIVVTSTTHIPSLETLMEEHTLIGFPGLDYISSEKTRKRIAEGKIKELGKNEALNTEGLLILQPDVIVAFSIDGSNQSLNNVQKSGIPVVFNSDWTENSPLGKAEWIKFFGSFYGKMDLAISFFEEVETEYLQAKALAETAETKPSVIAGAMYKDQWFLPAGDSWQALFLQDANAEYLFADSQGTGSLSLSIEAVLAQAVDADFWIGPAQFATYEELKDASPHYTRFSAFQKQKVYTFGSKKGETGGVVFYEQAPNRPDLVLKDLISILHPDLLPDYKTTFYKPLQ